MMPSAWGSLRFSGTLTGFFLRRGRGGTSPRLQARPWTCDLRRSAHPGGVRRIFDMQKGGRKSEKFETEAERSGSACRVGGRGGVQQRLLESARIGKSLQKGFRRLVPLQAGDGGLLMCGALPPTHKKGTEPNLSSELGGRIFVLGLFP